MAKKNGKTSSENERKLKKTKENLVTIISFKKIDYLLNNLYFDSSSE